MNTPLELNLLEAIELAKKVPESVAYRSGTVIKLDDKILSEGYSGEFGSGTHAEENALRKINGIYIPDNAVIYCSLAPCTFTFSRREACLERIAKRGIKKLVYASIAPADSSTLHKAGIEIIRVHGKLEVLAQALNPRLFGANINFGPRKR